MLARFRHLSLSSAVASAAALLCAGPAQAALRVQTQFSPQSLGPVWPTVVTYQVSLTADGRDERVWLGYFPRGFATEQGMPIEAASLGLIEDISITGGTLLGRVSFTQATILCSPRTPAHGIERTTNRWDVRVPAGGTAIATLKFETPVHRPWLDTSFGMDFTAEPRLPDGTPDRNLPTIHLPSAGPRYTGPPAVRIRLSSTPASGMPGADNPTVGRRRLVRIRGMTKPKLKNTRVSISIAGANGAREFRTRRINTRTDRNGRFALRHRFTQTGRYEVGARITTTPTGVRPDYGCPLGFVVK